MPQKRRSFFLVRRLRTLMISTARRPIIFKIPEEVKNLGPHDRLIRVYHFNRDPNQNQMITSLGSLVIKEGETLANVKICIQKKL
ncbi:ubiquitin C-terminal hydrolase 13-like isoform X2 [Zingiber officinale]|uniref:ubiquitin C-terminal hydrolase 13-like isoform X2 n=1 Tax=Zingiber officinale TaxID=94328 RepID=UPI001C4B63C1|nr:ubiquitin C-terminal hydrolase 13-like isoform X2 [Zingiber officinale]